MVTVSLGDGNGMEINSQDICAMETKSIVEINSLKVISSNLHCKRATKNKSTVDYNNVGTTGIGMSG